MSFGIGSKPVAKSRDSSKCYLDSPSLLCSEKSMAYAEKERRESERKMML